MTVQIKHKLSPKWNQIRSTHENMFKDCKERGWLMKDCIVTELTEAQVYTLYRSADGKNYATR